MWSNECACDLCYFYGLMTQGDGKGKFNGGTHPSDDGKKGLGQHQSLHWHMDAALLDGRDCWQMD